MVMSWTETNESTNDTDGTTYTGGSNDFTASSLGVAVMVNAKSGGTPAQPTLTGWTTQVSGIDLAPKTRITVHTKTSPSDGALTWDFGGVTQIGFLTWVGEIATDYGDVRQVKTGAQTGDIAGNIECAFDAAPLSDSAILVVVAGDTSANWTFPAGYTENADAGITTPPRRFGVGTRVGSGTQAVNVGTSVTTDTVQYVWALVEIQAASSEAPVAHATPAFQSGAAGASLVFDGSGSTGVGLAHAWTIVDAGTTGVTTGDFTGAATDELTVDTTGFTTGTAVLRLTVTDDFAATDTADVSFTITDASSGLVAYMWDDVTDAWVDTV